ncbi:class I SAM-dependent RNA methyltransferase [Cutibacterium sp. WCA-380-WT-3A]|uniref:Class I SAM-dependent RNA methyltransferase n=1 Tax=Cutibacterium porci TaxID=2605781 RepID=A0A7K0J6Y0_9ACTN|nr:class I SAM-dependent RNA methyltransferase [Cutibacterium porci]MSS45593.1 class I SAM-dependent RNA methyltransferase [Cutibacterium porci]
MQNCVDASQTGEVDLVMGNIAHGGYCVARLDGRVVFVRGALPGEKVRVRLTDTSKASHWFGHAVDIISADSHRVDAPCPVAGECGGCDFQHVDVSFQRELKRRVVAEQLSRLAGITWSGKVEAVDGSSDGLGWRTRMQYRSLNQRPALRRHRSHDLVQVPQGGCPIAHPAGRAAAETACRTAEQAIVMVTSCLTEDPEVSVIADGQLVSGGETMTAHVGQRRWKVGAGGFWQVHPGAAEALADAVVEGLNPHQGDEALDLYCGVGLFAGLLADRGVRVRGIEVSRQAVALARRNVPGGRFTAGRVERVLPRMSTKANIVVLDPPRKGAGKAVIQAVARTSPRAIAHVACDPAALARDVRLFDGYGYAPRSIRAFDVFPMTHHVEAVAVLEPKV